jgi:hypothetical protein
VTLEQIQQAIPQPLQTGLNWTSIGATVATIAGWLPNIAALLSIIWLSLQIFSWFEKRRSKKKE